MNKDRGETHTGPRGVPDLPGLGGIEVIARLRIADPQARILVLSMHDDYIHVTRALQAGAAGYVSKNAPPEELLEAVRRVAGGHTYIGDVTVPSRWTLNDGKTFYPADPRMFATVQTVVARGVPLEQVSPLGDCACLGLVAPDAVQTIHMPHKPQILLGGKGRSSDPFIGNAFPCIPGSGDVFGCQPCKTPRFAASDIPRFVQGAAPFLNPNFFLNYFKNPSTTPAGYDADDMETTADARVAAEKHVPFIGFRTLSDGLGDPLMLPGFPAQFFVYRQYAAENAAAVELAFLAAWAKH